MIAVASSLSTSAAPIDSLNRVLGRYFSESKSGSDHKKKDLANIIKEVIHRHISKII